MGQLVRISKSMPDPSAVHVPGVLGKKRKKYTKPQYPNAVTIK